MPNAGSQVSICDIPVRFDTYEGCSHNCSYCFVKRKYDIKDIKVGETAKTLQSFIEGKRNSSTKWCDFNIPLHWGGMSDPFQPVERQKKISLECLKVFEKTQYPFVVSTKNKLISEGEYLELVKRCNCVVQFSAACEEYDQFEAGASSFRERVEAASIISKHKRVVIRVQPYFPKFKESIKRSVPIFAKAGVYGCVFESIKYQYKAEGTIKLRGDFVYPSEDLERDFKELRKICHDNGLRFYCGENRLRGMGDSLCCCGIEGLGWERNTANLNHYLFDRGGKNHTSNEKEGFGLLFQSLTPRHIVEGFEHNDLRRGLPMPMQGQGVFKPTAA